MDVTLIVGPSTSPPRSDAEVEEITRLLANGPGDADGNDKQVLVGVVAAVLVVVLVSGYLIVRRRSQVAR